MDLYCIKTGTGRPLINHKKVYKNCILSILLVLIISSVYGQSETVSIHLQDVALETAIAEIRNQSDISFLYNDEEISQAPKVSISMENVSVEKALEQLLK